MKICFCHNTSGNTDIRYKILENTIQIERVNFPDSVHVSFSDGMSYPFDHPCLFEGKQLGHKVGSYHGLYKSLFLGFHFYPNCEYYLFSHDDNYLTNIQLFNKWLNKMNRLNLDFLGRQFKEMGANYFSFETVVFKRKALESFLINSQNLPITENDFPKDFRNSPSPEMLFGYHMRNIINKYLINLEQNSYGENCFGYSHIENKRGYGWN